MRPWLTCLALLPLACDGRGTSTSPAAASLAPGRNVAETPVAPRDVTRSFLEAAEAADHQAAAALLTSAARECWTSENSSMSWHERGWTSFEVAEPQIEGDQAQVTVTGRADEGSETMTFLMRHEDRHWRIYGFAKEQADGSVQTVDLEQVASMMAALESSLGEGMQQAFAEAFEEARRQELLQEVLHFDELQATTRTAVYRQSTIDLAFTQVAAADAVAEVLEGTGIIFDRDGDPALQQPIDLQEDNVSRVFALELICARVGLYPLYPDENNTSHGGAQNDTPPAVTFAPLPRPLPIVFVGPFCIAITSVEENVPHATGSVTLCTRTLGLPAAVRGGLSEMYESTRIAAVVNARGESLTSHEDVRFMGSPLIVGALTVSQTTLDLKNLLQDVDHIAHIRGRLILPVPTWVETLEFARCTEGDSHSVAGLVATVTAASGTQTSVTITGDDGDREGLAVRFCPVNTRGDPLSVMSGSAYDSGSEVRADLLTQEPHAGTSMKLFRTEPLEFEFDVRDIPLQHSAEMPLELQALSFGDHPAPLSGQFQGFTDRDADFPQGAFALTNHSNKIALGATVSFEYQNASGGVLADQVHSLTGEFTMEGHQPLATASATVEHETTLFFMPDGTAGVRVIVQQVEFADGTTWDAP